MASIHVVPAEGRIVRDPITGLPLPPEGKAVADSIFWKRRVKGGDVAIRKPLDVKPKEPESKPAPKKTSKN